jgi:hypothetical protein
MNANAFVEAIRRLRDAAAAKLAAQPVDDAPTIAVAKANNNIIPLPKRKPGLLAALASAGDYADEPKPTYSMPLVHTHNSGGSRAINLNDEFPQSLATYNWLRSQQR